MTTYLVFVNVITDFYELRYTISVPLLLYFLTDILGMFKVSARWVPIMLTDDQKRSRLDISRYLLSRYEDDPGDFIVRVVTQCETLVHHFDPESKM